MMVQSNIVVVGLPQEMARNPLFVEDCQKTPGCNQDFGYLQLPVVG